MRLCSSCAILPVVRHYRVDAANAVHNLDDPQIDKEACERDGFLARLRMCRLYNSTGTAIGERSSQAQKEFPCPILLPQDEAHRAPYILLFQFFGALLSPGTNTGCDLSDAAKKQLILWTFQPSPTRTPGATVR
jgi:hypothetical protein